MCSFVRGWVLGRCLTTTLGGNGQDVSFLFVRWALFVLWTCMGLIVLQKVDWGACPQTPFRRGKYPQCRLRRASWPVPFCSLTISVLPPKFHKQYPHEFLDPKGMEVCRPLSFTYLLSKLRIWCGSVESRSSSEGGGKPPRPRPSTSKPSTEELLAWPIYQKFFLAFQIFSVFFFLWMLAFQSKSDIFLSKLQTFVETKFRRVWRGKFYRGGHGTRTTSGRSSGSSIVAKRLGSGGARNVGALQRCWKIECESFHVFMIFHCSSQPRRTWIIAGGRVFSEVIRAGLAGA